MATTKPLERMPKVRASHEAIYYEVSSFPALPSNNSPLPEFGKEDFIKQMSTISPYCFNDEIQGMIRDEVHYVRNLPNKPLHLAIYATDIRNYLDKPKEIRIQIAYLLTIMDTSKVYSDVFKTNAKQDATDLLFREEIFPTDPTAAGELFGYIKRINQILYNWYTTVPEDQTYLLGLIYQYVQSKTVPNTIYNFLPFISLILNSPIESNLYSVFAHSELFQLIAEYSFNHDEMAFFNIVRNFFEISPLLAFQVYRDILTANQQLPPFPRFYSKPQCRKDIANCIKAAFNELIAKDRDKQVTQDMYVVFNHISAIIELYETQENPNELLPLYEGIYNMFEFKLDVYSYIMNDTGIFLNLAKVSLRTNQLFNQYIQLLTRMYPKHDDFDNIIAVKYKIYSILEEYTCKERPDLTILEAFSLLSQPIEETPSPIENIKAIRLILALLPRMLDYEERVVQFFLTQIKDTKNKITLKNAKLPEFILKRLTQIQLGNLPQVVTNYLQIYQAISEVFFDNSVFFKTVETLSDSDFPYANNVIMILNNLLTEARKQQSNNTSELPNIYTVLQTANSLIHLIPLLGHSTAQIDSTRDFLINLIQIFKNMVSTMKQAQENFINVTFFPLASSFLLQCDEHILNEGFMKELFSLYEALNNFQEMRYQMAQFIIFNYDFLFRNNKIKRLVVLDLLTTVIDDQHPDAFDYSLLNSIILKTYEHFGTQSDESEKAFDLLLIMFRNCLNNLKEIEKNSADESIYRSVRKSYIVSFVKTMMNRQTTYSLVKFLDVLNRLLDTHLSDVEEHLAEETMLNSLIALLGEPTTHKVPKKTGFIVEDVCASTEGLILTIDIINKLKQSVNFHKVMYQCATVIESTPDNAQEFVRAVFNKFFNVENEGSSQPTLSLEINYLPLLMKSCEGLIATDQDNLNFVRTDICEKITQYISQYTKEFHRIVQLPCWYSWLHQLFELVYTQAEDSHAIAIPFATLFEIDFSERNMEQINRYFCYLYSKEYEFTTTIEFLIFQSLLFGDQAKHDQAVTIFQIVFNYLIFEKKVTFAESGNGVNCSYTCRNLTPEIIQTENGIVSQLLGLTINGSDFTNTTINIGGSEMKCNILIASSILVSIFFKQDPEQYSKFAHSIVSCIKQFDSDIGHYSLAYLKAPSTTNDNTQQPHLNQGIDDNILQLLEDINQFTPEQLLKFKCKYNEMINSNLPAAQAHFLLQIHNILQLAREDKDACIEVDDDAESEATESLSLSMSLTLNLLNQDEEDKKNSNNRIFLQNQQHRSRNEMRRILALKNEFVRNLNNIPGPWFKDNEAIKRKYKAFSFISKKGQRILLTINNDFHDHKDASENTQNITPTNQPAENVERKCLFYKEAEEIDEFYLEMNEYQVNLRLPEANYPQILRFTTNRILLHSDTEEGKSTANMIYLSDIAFILNRSATHEDRACEIFLNEYQSYYLIFSNNNEREQFYQNIDNIIASNPSIEQKRKEFESVSNKFDLFTALRQKLNSIHQSKKQTGKDLVALLDLSTLWKQHILTNYEYIYYLNLLSGRSFNDVNKYPMMPQLIKENVTASIDLSNEQIYRDLHLPPLKLSPAEFHSCINKLDPSQESTNVLCLNDYPSNVFTPITFMLRVEPFTTAQIRHQQSNGVPCFLAPGRQFVSVKAMMCYLYRGARKQEAIPEFFTFPYLYTNENQFNLGNWNGHPIDDVILSNWANHNPYVYTAVNRIAFESEYVSANLNCWIDLFFTEGRGYCKDDVKNTEETAQTGIIDVSEEAIDQTELVNPEIIKPTSKTIYQMYQNTAYPEKNNAGADPCQEEVGVLPEILFTKKHVHRETFNLPVEQTSQNSIYKSKQPVFSIIKEVAFCDDSVIVDLRNYKPNVTNPTSFKAKAVKGELQCVLRNKKQNHQCNESPLGENFAVAVFCTKHDHYITALNLFTQKAENICQSVSIITAVASIGNRYIVTGGSDCSLNIYKAVFRPPQKQTGFGFLKGLFSSSKPECEFKFVSSSGFHSSEIVAIGGCYQNGLIVSLDTKNMLIFETLTSNPIFINHFDLTKLKTDDDESNEVYMNTRIFVLKSGIVAVALKQKVIFFDSHGALIHQWDLCMDITNIKNYYGRDTREQFLVSTAECVYLFDVTTLRNLGTIDGNMQQFSPIHGTNSMITYQDGGFQIVDFGQYENDIIEFPDN